MLVARQRYRPFSAAATLLSRKTGPFDLNWASPSLSHSIDVGAGLAETLQGIETLEPISTSLRDSEIVTMGG
jgi:hypothetical protein